MNKATKPAWLLCDRTFTMTVKNTMFWVRVAVAKGLLHHTLKNNAKLYKIFSVDIEEDPHDHELKLYSVTILGLIVSVGFV